MNKVKILSKLPTILFLGTAILAAAAAWLYVSLHVLPIPVGDEWWDTVHVAALTRQGSLSVQDIFAYSEGHRSVNIRLIAWAMTLLTDYNPILLSSFTWLITVLNVYLAFMLFTGFQKNGIAVDKKAKFAALSLFSITLFTISHGQNWVDFYFSQWQLSLLFILLGAAFIRYAPGNLFGLTVLALLAVLSSFSLGLGLGSWISFPIMATSNKGFRKIGFLIAWILVTCGFLLFYFSDFARFSTKPSVSIDRLSSPKNLVLLLGFYLSRRFWLPGYNAYLFFASFALASFTVFLLLMFAHWKKGFLNEVLLWGGLSLFSLFGSLMVFISRGSLKPSERHSPGSDGFWLALISLSILYLASSPNYLKNSLSWSVKTGKSILISIITSVGILGGVRSISAFGDKGYWMSAFPRSCAEAARAYPLHRDNSFRKCFVYGDERSTYQLSLMEIGGMSARELKRPIYDNNETKLIAIFPSRLMAAFANRYLLTNGLKNGQLFDRRIVFFTPSLEKSLSPILFTHPLAKEMEFWNATPLTKHMDWNDLGRGEVTPTSIHDFQSLKKQIGGFNPNVDRILVISAMEMSATIEMTSRLLKEAGFKEVSNDSLRKANQRFPSLIAQCFEAKNTRNQPPSAGKCAGYNFAHIHL